MTKKHGRKPKDRKPDHEAQAKAAEAQAPEQAAPQETTGAVQAERDDLLARLQRVSADYLNYQKRVQRDIAQAHQFANEELIKALLSVLDDMERALAAARENHADDDPLLSGMQLVHDKALETLGGFGLRAIEAVGRPFDPDRHSAMMQEPSRQHPPMTVLRELQRGYALRGRTIRPSAVVVSKAPDEVENAEDEQEAGEHRNSGEA